MSGKSEVHDDWLKRESSFEHYVFRFEVTMHDPVPVHAVEPWDQPRHALPDFCLCEVAVPFLDAVEELSSRKEIDNYVDGVVRLENPL